MNNPINFIKNLLANANPQTIAMKMIGNSNPVLGNLAQMAEKGDEKAIENFARNLSSFSIVLGLFSFSVFNFSM